MSEPMNSAFEQDTYTVVTELTVPGLLPHLTPLRLHEQQLTVTELSARYPRSRRQQVGSLVLATYDLETGIYDSESYVERIVPPEDNETMADPRLFDDEIEPELLPPDYVIGDGYLLYQAIKNPQFRYYRE